MYIIEPRLVSSHMEFVSVIFKQDLRCLALAKTWLAH